MKQNGRPTVSIVIPAFNEAARIERSLREIDKFIRPRPHFVEVIVVADGCTDETVPIVRRVGGARLRVIDNSQNRGKGSCVAQGVQAAAGEYVLFVDTDLSAPIEEVDKLLDIAIHEHAEIVIGSRNVDRAAIETHQPWFREAGGFAFNFAVRLLLGLDFRDTQCGFKLFHRLKTRPVFERLTTPGWGFDPELLFLAKRSGLRTREVSVRWGHHAKGSRFKPLRHGSRMFADLFRVRWLSIIGRYS
jgi:glycosyltransferase involved in cell wall biosynthesis